MPLSPTYIGEVGATGVYRISLADFRLARIGEIAILDDRVISGGTGAASGFDLDFITISPTFTNSPSSAASLTSVALSNFTFNAAMVAFRAGFEQSWTFGDPSEWNSASLFGTVVGSGNVAISFGESSFGVRDGVNVGRAGGLSLGEGGVVSFILNSQIDPSNLYLYFGDAGGGNDTVFVDAASALSHALLPGGLALRGTSSADDIRLGTGLNINLGAGNDAVNGAGGNDMIFTGPGNDRLAGSGGNDTLDGGIGTDVAVYRGTRDQYVVTQTSGTTMTVSDRQSGRDGTDQLSNIEGLVFANPEVYRFHNTVSGGHLFTTSAAERDSIIRNLPAIRYEGIEFYGEDQSGPGATQVFRFLNTVAGSHLFTTDAAERDSIIRNLPGLRYEGVSYYASDTPQDGFKATYRFLNTTNGGHFFTTSAAERDAIMQTLPGLHYEGIAYYVPTKTTDAIFDF